MKPFEYAVSYVVFADNKVEGSADDKILLVTRPSTDKNLPNAVGLPAGNVMPTETMQEAVLRSGKQKLGVNLDIVGFLGRGNLEREHCILHMEQFLCTTNDTPDVGQQQPSDGNKITLYQACHWGSMDELRAAAEGSSLCSRLCLNKYTGATYCT
eukprot:TRINITY_DN22399_c0_g1_i1.p1 TRINITY_DN22399_c0_g1~~TRINITY_DN22399_c0_g1_i1.p1  ORF type:complete len:155 (+),score=10.56 TRINITY_DN22399_c0_g1_i1:42-506(+)